MPSRKRLTKLADRTVTSYGTDKYTKRFDKFWGALEKRKGHDVAEDRAGELLYKFAARNNAPLGTAPGRLTKEAIKKRVKRAS